jgi:hypothetical protein
MENEKLTGNNGKTLIIHPKDNSTSFLDIVYNNIPEDKRTIVTGGISKAEVTKLMREHRRIMMMGHGSPGGLFAVGQFHNCGAYVIDQDMISVLRTKEDNVYIWCNADKFVDAFDLKGFYSGMFISEVGEATYCGLPGMSQDIVDESNYGFCNIIGKYINEGTEDIHTKVKEEYGVIAENNPVATYNFNRLYKSI